MSKRKDESRSCEKSRHLERGTHLPDSGIPKREEVEMVWTCAKGEIKMMPREIYYRWQYLDGKRNRGRPKLRARPGERGYGQKPDDDWYGRGPKTLACHDLRAGTLRSVEADMWEEKLNIVWIRNNCVLSLMEMFYRGLISFFFFYKKIIGHRPISLSHIYVWSWVCVFFVIMRPWQVYCWAEIIALPT